MATSTSDSNALKNDITECSICKQTYTDPRILACAHSFCLGCVEQHGKDKKPGELLPCPLCRTDFTVPAGGLKDVTKNFFIDRLCEINSSSSLSTDAKLCKLCSDDKGTGNAATSLCLDCQQQLCNACTNIHKNQTFGSSHNVVAFGSKPPEEMIKNSPSYCKTHSNERITLHCSSCRKTLCLICYVSSHKSHDCNDVDAVAKELEKQLQINAEKTKQLLDTFKNRTDGLIQMRDAYIDRTKKAEAEVVARGDELKRLVDEHTKQLVEELNGAKNKTTKEFEKLLQETEFHIASLQNMHRYVDEVLRRGRPADVCRAADDVEVRTNELLTLRLEDFGAVYVSFNERDMHDIISQNMLGAIHISNDLVSASPTLEHTIPGSVRVFGVASIAGCVYVARENKPEIAVHDSTTFNLLRQMTVIATLDPVDIKSCVINQCLYVSDFNGCKVHKVTLSGTTTTWDVGDKPDGLSVCDDGNVVVCYPETKKIKEHNTDGTCLLTVDLTQQTGKPGHAVRLNSSTFVVCDAIYGHASGTGNHRVYTAGHDGRITSTYGTSQPGSTIGQLNSPWHLAVDCKGNVLVADSNNGRVVLLSKSLTYIRDIIPNSVPNVYPTRMYLDAANRRLYVVIWSGNVLVYKLA